MFPAVRFRKQEIHLLFCRWRCGILILRRNKTLMPASHEGFNKKFTFWWLINICADNEGISCVTIKTVASSLMLLNLANGIFSAGFRTRAFAPFLTANLITRAFFILVTIWIIEVNLSFIHQDYWWMMGTTFSENGKTNRHSNN